LNWEKGGEGAPIQVWKKNKSGTKKRGELTKSSAGLPKKRGVPFGDKKEPMN